MRATFPSTSGFMNYFSSPDPKTLQQIKKTDWDSSVNCREGQKIIWAMGGGGVGALVWYKFPTEL